MPGTSLAPFQKCVAPGTSSSSTVAPAARSAPASRMLWAGGTRLSAAPCMSSTGGAAALAWATGLASRASSGTAAAGAPRSSASRDSGPGSGTPPASATSDGSPGKVGDREPGDHAVHLGAGQGGQQRQVTAGRIAPAEHPAGVEPVRGAVVADPADRGAHVVQRRREARLAAEPVVDRGHREALPGQVVVEARPQHGQRVAT